MKTLKLSNRQYELAANGGLTVLIQWPAEYIGDYGSGQFDGSYVSRESCDRVMDTYVHEHLAIPAGMAITNIIPGRAYRRGSLVPAIHVTIMDTLAAAGGYDVTTGVRRKEWIDGVTTK